MYYCFVCEFVLFQFDLCLSVILYSSYSYTLSGTILVVRQDALKLFQDHTLPSQKHKINTTAAFSTTTTTTTKTFDMSSWDGLTHVDDPRFQDCFEEFPDLKEIENPTPGYNLRNICLALNRTGNYYWCTVALESARVITQTLSTDYCTLATTNCTKAVSPPITEPVWCKKQPLKVDPDAVSFVGSAPAQTHRIYESCLINSFSISSHDRPVLAL